MPQGLPNSVIVAALIGFGVAGSLYIAEMVIGGGPHCPPPSPRSVDALFAPCLSATPQVAEATELPNADNEIVPILPGPTPRQAPSPPDMPAVAANGRSAPLDVGTTGSVRSPRQKTSGSHAP